MKQSEFNQIKAFINYLSRKQSTGEARAALEDVVVYLSDLADKAQKIDGRSESWTEERKTAHKDFWAKRREDKLLEKEVARSEKEATKKIWFWDYDNEPPTHVTKEEAAEIVGKTKQQIDKGLLQDNCVMAMPKQLRSVCFTLTNSPQALHWALQQTDRTLSQRPKSKK